MVFTGSSTILSKSWIQKNLLKMNGYSLTVELHHEHSVDLSWTAEGAYLLQKVTLTSIGSMYWPEGMESRYFFRSMDRNSKMR